MPFLSGWNDGSTGALLSRKQEAQGSSFIVNMANNTSSSMSLLHPSYVRKPSCCPLSGRIGSIGWIFGFGVVGSVALPFMTGALANKLGIKSLQLLLTHAARYDHSLGFCSAEARAYAYGPG